MSDFKVGDKVRATEEFAQETIDMSLADPQGDDVPVTERRTLTVVHIDDKEHALWPIGALENPDDFTGDYLGEGMLLFDPGEIEHVED